MSTSLYTVALTELQMGAIRCALRGEVRTFRALAEHRANQGSNADLLAMANEAAEALQAIEAATKVPA